MPGLERGRAAPACARSPRRPCRRAARRAAARAARVARHIAISSWRLAPWLSVPAVRAGQRREAGGVERLLAPRRGLRAVARRALPEGPRPRRLRLRREAAVLEHAELGEDRGALVAAAEAGAGAPRLRPAGDVVAGEAHRAGGRRELAGEHVDQRRLAGAVGADHGMDLADVQVERDRVDRGQAAEAAAEAGGLEQRRLSHGALPRSSAPRPIRPFGSSATKAMIARPERQLPVRRRAGRPAPPTAPAPSAA